MQTTGLDPDTERAVRVFLQKIAGRYAVAGVILSGSRARHHHRPESDVDIAVLLQGRHGERVDAAVDMAGIAFDVLLETDVLVEALPLWEDEWEHQAAIKAWPSGANRNWPSEPEAVAMPSAQERLCAGPGVGLKAINVTPSA